MHVRYEFHLLIIGRTLETSDTDYRCEARVIRALRMQGQSRISEESTFFSANVLIAGFENAALCACTLLCKKSLKEITRQERQKPEVL